ncbi:MAG: AAA family ATPase [Burkholderiaceae bacterium]
MLQISLTGQYRSLQNLDLELPDFCVITGVNGSGKSHLLNGIHQNSISISKNGTPLANRHLQPVGGFGNSDPGVSGANTLARQLENIWQGYQNEVRRPNIDRLSSIPVIGEVAKFVAQKCNKNVLALTQADFLLHGPEAPQRLLHLSNYLFQITPSEVFKAYSERIDENRYRRFQNEIYGEKDIVWLSEEELKRQHGPEPWYMLNRCLEKARLNYRITYPTTHGKNLDFRAELINQTTGKPVAIGDLSTGEQILYSLAMGLFNAESGARFPDLLMLDEPDAYLHPSMSRQMLAIINDVFVRELGIPVIITTHSLATVALAPDDSIYAMDQVARSPNKVTKDLALKMLGAEVPILSINYDNRRLVFVEGKHDATCYTNFLAVLNPLLVTDVSLCFTSSGNDGSGSCEQVKEIVKKLEIGGVTTVRGVIDWDGKNDESQTIKVLGLKKRYSLENYIFDPLALISFLRRKNYIKNEDLGFSSTTKVSELTKLDSARLQSAVNIVTDKVLSKLGTAAAVDSTEVNYVCGQTLHVPTDYLRARGKDLESAIKAAFPQLNQYRNEGSLLNAVADMTTDESGADLLPDDWLELMRSLTS